MALSELNSDLDLLGIGTSQWPEFRGYQKLDRSRKEIRLLRVSAIDDGSLITCQLMHQSLEKEPRYSALSYHWGAPGELATIFVEGMEVQIRETLHCFLRRLASHINPITIWLDAICINQRDVDERNWQVSLMPEIYSTAESVYAWLGEGDADCIYAMKYAHNLATNGAMLTAVPTAKIVSEYFERLFFLPYWSRVWVIQECVLAKQLWLLCSSQLIIWEDVAAAFDRLLDVSKIDGFPHAAPRDWLFREGREPEVQEDALAISRFLRFKNARKAFPTKRSSLLELVQEFRHQHCTDPRDKFYGLLGLANNSTLTKVDYDNSAPYVFFQALSSETATITRRMWTSRMLHTKLDVAIRLCSNLSMTSSDIRSMLSKTRKHSVLDWPEYRGKVVSCTLVDSNDYASTGARLWRIEAEHPWMYHSTHADVKPGDLVYATGYREHSDMKSHLRKPVEEIAFAFRHADTHSRAIDLLMEDVLVTEIRCRQADVARILLNDHEDLRNACVDNVELCSANAPLLHALRRRPGIILAHISYRAMMALTAWSICKRIPDYVNDLNDEHTAGIQLCRGSNLARIDVQTSESGEEVFSAPWYCCEGSD